MLTEQGARVLRRAVEWIDANPNTLYMGSWGRRSECGTTRCLAGWVTHFAYPTAQWGWDARPDPDAPGSQRYEASTVKVDGVLYHPSEAAALALSGDPDAHRSYPAALFYSSWEFARAAAVALIEDAERG